MSKIALYTTFFPAILPFVGDWFRSVLKQELEDFDIWIALDGVDRQEAHAATGQEITATFVEASAGATPAAIRNEVWQEMVSGYDMIIMTDADDVLHPTRVRAASEALQSVDLVACALRIVNEEGRPTGRTMTLARNVDLPSFLARGNIYGLSNTAFRTDLLSSILPVPPEVEVVDWHLASAALRAGGTLGFDPAPRMDYRRYGGNLAPIAPPVDETTLARGTAIVQRHLKMQRGLAAPQRQDTPCAATRLDVAIHRRWGEVMTFSRAMQDPERRSSYLTALASRSDRNFAWWEFIAMPELEDLWNH